MERIAAASRFKFLTINSQTYEPMAYQNYTGAGEIGGVRPKSNTWPKVQPNLRPTAAASRTGSRYETNDTDFEEDMSDYDEYSGRRSEDSVSRFLFEPFQFLCPKSNELGWGD